MSESAKKVAIDPAARDIVQNIYLREVKRVDGQLRNIEFATVSMVKNPVKAARGGDLDE